MNRPPMPTEVQRVVIQLDGRTLQGDVKQKFARYARYMKALRAVVEKHGAKLTAKECLLKQSEITRTKKALLKAK